MKMHWKKMVSKFSVSFSCVIDFFMVYFCVKSRRISPKNDYNEIGYDCWSLEIVVYVNCAHQISFNDYSFFSWMHKHIKNIAHKNWCEYWLVCKFSICKVEKFVHPNRMLHIYRKLLIRNSAAQYYFCVLIVVYTRN